MTESKNLAARLWERTFFILFCFETVLCCPCWPQTHCVVMGDLELSLILLLLLPECWEDRCVPRPPGLHNADDRTLTSFTRAKYFTKGASCPGTLTPLRVGFLLPHRNYSCLSASSGAWFQDLPSTSDTQVP